VLFSDENRFLFKGSKADVSGSGRVSSEVLPILMKW